jgi:hypothetical protein
MANKKIQLGKTVKQIGGYHIKPLLDNKGNTTKGFGLYAGKNLIESAPTVSRLETIANGIINKQYTYRKYWCKKGC